ncbi:MAG: hypothetical protein R2799_00245 [Crocinitomicaceae bacterium]
MELFKFIFHLGIVFAIFSFVWFFLMLGINLLMAGRRTKFLNYLYKLIKYMFLSSVTARFILEFSGEDIQSSNGIAYFSIGGLILLMYWEGKLQKRENMLQMQAMMSKMMPGISQPIYDRTLEIATIGVGIVNFIACVFYPAILNNAFITWFSSTIHGIYEAPIIGFIFKVIGFFFLISILFKGITSIGRALGILPAPPEVNSSFNFEMFQNFQNQNPWEEKKDEDDFDDFEEVEEEEK